MKGIIVNYRGGKHTQYNNHMIIIADGVESRDKAAALVGKKVAWKNAQGRAINGEVRAAHGAKGAVRAIFEKGMPGQSVGTPVEIQ